MIRFDQCSTLMPSIALAAGCGLACAALSAMVVHAVKDVRIRELEAQVSALQDRAALMERFARSLDGVALQSLAMEGGSGAERGTPLTAVAPGAQMSAAVRTGGGAAKPDSRAPSERFAQGSADTQVMPTSQSARTALPSQSSAAQAAVGRAAQPIPAAPQQSDVTAQSVPPAPAVKAHESAAASQRPASTAERVELVSSRRAGVDRLEQGVVIMLGGRRVQVGEAFDSGEVLKAVDPVRGRVATDRRTLVLLSGG